MVEHRLKEKLLYVLYVIVKTVGLMEKQTSSQINDIFFGLNNHKSESPVCEEVAHVNNYYSRLQQ